MLSLTLASAKRLLAYPKPEPCRVEKGRPMNHVRSHNLVTR